MDRVTCYSEGTVSVQTNWPSPADFNAAQTVVFNTLDDFKDDHPLDLLEAYPLLERLILVDCMVTSMSNVIISARVDHVIIMNCPNLELNTVNMPNGCHVMHIEGVNTSLDINQIERPIGLHTLNLVNCRNLYLKQKLNLPRGLKDVRISNCPRISLTLLSFAEDLHSLVVQDDHLIRPSVHMLALPSTLTRLEISGIVLHADYVLPKGLLEFAWHGVHFQGLWQDLLPIGLTRLEIINSSRGTTRHRDCVDLDLSSYGDLRELVILTDRIEISGLPNKLETLRVCVFSPKLVRPATLKHLEVIG